MRIEVLKTYRDEVSIAVIMPWPHKENPSGCDGVIYNKTVCIDLWYQLLNGVRAKNFKKVKGILKRNRFTTREYKAGVTNLYI